MKTCNHCNNTKTANELVPSYSPFYPTGRTNLCYECVEQLVDPTDLNQVDRWCQFANMAFLPDEWRKQFKQYGKAAFKRYAESYHTINYYKYDWGDQNELLMDKAKKGIVDMEIEELKPALMAKLRLAWGDLPQNDLLRLEEMFNSSLEDYVISTAGEKDMLRKVCRLSLMVDQDFAESRVDKDKIGEYNKLMTALQKVVEKNQGDGISSIGQLINFIEKHGYKPNFYDGVPRDELDLLEKNIKEHISDAVYSAMNITEVFEQSKKALDKKKNRGKTQEELDLEELEDE